MLVGNAGFTRAETMAHVDASAWEREIAINLTGTYNVVAPVLAQMRAGGGAIVLVASVNGLGHYGNPAYSAAKAGMLAYARAIAVEHGRDNIRANCVCPGSVRTPAWDHRLAANPALLGEVSKHYPLGRLVTPEEVANAVLFLASPLSAGITGTALVVDVGLTAGNLRALRPDVLGGSTCSPPPARDGRGRKGKRGPCYPSSVIPEKRGRGRATSQNRITAKKQRSPRPRGDDQCPKCTLI